MRFAGPGARAGYSTAPDTRHWPGAADLARLGDARIDVTATDGEVWLEGEIDSWFERYAAGDAATHVAGVTEVHNNLDVGVGWTG